MRCGHKQDPQATNCDEHTCGAAHSKYVLEAGLQDGKKIPKWDTRARLGIFVGFSPVHSLLVPLMLNVRTGKIGPQYTTSCSMTSSPRLIIYHQTNP